MSVYRYVTLDPTGNITCLVLDSVEPADEALVTHHLMKECEQVAYLESPSLPGAKARIRLMGGEFCGNAAMAAACWLAAQDHIPPRTKVSVPLEVSGAEGVLSCLVSRDASGCWEGTVTMPRVLSVFPFSYDRYVMTAVRMEGILHLIYPTENLISRSEAEHLLRAVSNEVLDEAVGFLQWQENKHTMHPLVYVKQSHTLVWETGCGSGSAAIGAWQALRQGDGTWTTSVQQPGGIIRSTVVTRKGAVLQVMIAGAVRIGSEQTLSFSEGNLRR